MWLYDFVRNLYSFSFYLPFNTIKYSLGIVFTFSKVYLAIVLIKEVLLMFVYILCCCIYHWLGLSNSGRQVTWMKVHRWCIEATCLPVLYLAFLFEYLVGQTNFIFDEHQTYYFAMISLKLPLFFIMRFAESRSNFVLNHLELFLLRETCEFFFGWYLT